MNNYKRVLSSGIVLMSSLLMISCNQSSSDNQVSNVNSEGATTVDIVSSKTGPSVALSTSELNAVAGGTYSVDILMTDFTMSEGGGITLRYDPSMLQVTNVAVDNSVWDFINKNGFINNAEGKVSDILFSSYRGVSGDAKIATVEIRSLKNGTSSIAIEESASNPFAGDGQKIVVAFNSTTVISN